jgi:hypothetical protein
MSLKLPLTLIVWDGHSCPSPLTLILILTLILTLTGKGTSSTRAASALHVWSGHSCPLPLILISQGARTDPCKAVEEGASAPRKAPP